MINRSRLPEVKQYLQQTFSTYSGELFLQSTIITCKWPHPDFYKRLSLFSKCILSNPKPYFWWQPVHLVITTCWCQSLGTTFSGGRRQIQEGEVGGAVKLAMHYGTCTMKLLNCGHVCQGPIHIMFWPYVAIFCRYKHRATTFAL